MGVRTTSTCTNRTGPAITQFEFTASDSLSWHSVAAYLDTEGVDPSNQIAAIQVNLEAAVSPQMLCEAIDAAAAKAKERFVA